MPLLLTPHRHRVILARWSFDGTVLTVTAEHPDITASAASPQGTSVTLEAQDNGYTTSPNASGNTPNTNAAGAISNNRWLQYDFTVDTGTVNVSLLTFKAARGGSTTPRGFTLRSNYDSYTADIASSVDIGTQRTTWTDYSYDLSATHTAMSSVLFRFYIYAPTSGSSIDMDDVTVWGAFT